MALKKLIKLTAPEERPRQVRSIQGTMNNLVHTLTSAFVSVSNIFKEPCKKKDFLNSWCPEMYF